jgi:N6-adenosine-specific RNA methylase IME4
MLGNDKYSLVLIDPPWRFRVWSAKGTGRSAEQHYPVQGYDFLMNMNLRDLTTDDAVMFLWTTTPHSVDFKKVKVDGIDYIVNPVASLLHRWGFSARTKVYWVKHTKGKPHRPAMSMGYYTRGCVEELWICVKNGGSAPVSDHGVLNLLDHTVLLDIRRQHSEKPDSQYDMIDALYPDRVNRCEIFARKKQPGYDVWGNEVDCDFEIKDFSGNTIEPVPMEE